MKQRVALSILCLFLSLHLWAQKSYATVALEEIASLMEGRSIGGLTCEEEDGVVTHLGLSIFPRKMDYPYGEVCRFVERYALHCILLPEVQRRRLLHDDQVEIDLEAVAKKDSLSPVRITEVGARIEVAWDDCQLCFPKNFSLVSGLNKKESDAYFVDCLQSYMASCRVDRGVFAESEERFPIDSASYVVNRGEHYIIKEISDDSYYVRLGDNSLRPIYSGNFAEETVSNLLLSLVEGDFTLHISQNMYGYRNVEYSLPLKFFSDFCRDAQGCRPFVGIESETEDSVTAIVVYCNDFFAYNHLLYVNIPRSCLETRNGVLDATLYCYIPTHNLKTLF